MSDEYPHSGSRWEPTEPESGWTLPPVDTTPRPRRNLRRAGLLAAAAAGRLAVGTST